MSDRFEFKSAEEIWREASAVEPPAYFVSQDQIYGDPRIYGPYTVLEAEWRFSHTYPAFDGADVSIIKVAPVIAGISPKELMDNAFREEDEINVDPETQKWGDLYHKSATVVAWNEWKVTEDQAGLIYHGAENKRDPEFQKEITQEADEEIAEQRQIERTESNRAYAASRVERLKQASVTMREIDPEKRTAEVEQEPPLPWYEQRAYGGREADDATERQIEAMQAEHDRERELSNPRGIYSIYESAWLQGFNSELKEHIGKDKDGKFYYATEHSESPEDDLCWRGPHATREEAEQGLSDAYDRWDKRTGDEEQAYEDQQIAQNEVEHEQDMEVAL